MNYSKFEPLLGDWALKFKQFIESPECDKIYSFLKKESSEDKIICPHRDNTFRAFKETPFEKLKCVFILQDPYHQIVRKDNKLVHVADGLAMSCSNTGIIQPSLELFYKGIENDLGEEVVRQPDLSYLAHQGVLLLNTSLTVEMDKPGSHSKIGLWDEFNDYLVQEVINYYTKGLIYVSFGKNAQLMAKTIIPFLHWGFEVEHPAFAARKERDWNHKNIFSKINKILKDCNNEQILWNYEDYRRQQSGETIQCPSHRNIMGSPTQEVVRRTGVGGKVREN